MSDTDRADVRIDLLGPLEVRVDGAAVALPGDRPAVLLAVLALAVGRPVGVDTLVRAVWEDAPPQRMRGSLQSLVMRLRRALAAPVIGTSAAGYTLQVEEEHVDLWRFRRLVADAAAERDVDPAAARETLTRALGLWRGEPFGGLRVPTADGAAATALREEWIAAKQERIEIDVASGRSAPAVPELRNLTRRFPLRESLWRLLITALADAGQPAEAVQAYHEVSRNLTDQLGLEPSRDLQAVYQRLLRSLLEPAVRVRRESGHADGAAAGSGGRPRQLLADAAFFVGRRAELAALDAHLATSRESMLFLATVDGPAGAGKSALATHWAHRVRDRFPDGQLYLDLGGFTADGAGDAMRPAAAATALLLSLGIPADRMPETLDEQSALLRSILADRRILVVLDNALDAEQVRPLLPGRGGYALVTSRNQLRGLITRNGAHRVTLNGLLGQDAADLLAAHIGQERSMAEPDAFRELARLCTGLPLALCIAAERITRDPQLPLADLVERFRDERQRLDLLADDQDPAGDMRAALAASRRRLSKDADCLFPFLGLHPPRQITVASAASLAGTRDTAPVRAALDQLVAFHLLEERRPGRYELDALPRLYAAELATLELTRNERIAAAARLTEYHQLNR